MSPRRRRFVAPLLWAAVVGVASVTPPSFLGASATGGALPFDLAFHFIGYAVLAVLLVRADLTLELAVLVASTFGLGIEGVQFLLPFRTASLLDAGINLAGACVGTLLQSGRLR